MTRPRLPLSAWTGLLSGGGVLAVGGVASAVLATVDELDVAALEALGAGTCAGLLLAVAAGAAAARWSRALRRLCDDALDPDLPRPAQDGAEPAASADLVELAGVLAGLQQRVRVSEELCRRHRREAETVATSVSELLSGLVAAEEAARGHLAAELHDTVAQSLMMARSLLSAGPSSPGEIAQVAAHVEDAEEQVRGVLARTRPPALAGGDLAAAVSALQADVRVRYGLEVDLRWPRAPHPLPAASAVTLYRFFQEGLHNVVKHADVDRARLALDVQERTVRATVSDDGPGFDPGTVRPAAGRSVGLSLLRDRARLAGGALEVDSRPGRGTTLTLTLPRPAVVVPAQRQPTGSVPTERART